MQPHKEFYGKWFVWKCQSHNGYKQWTSSFLVVEVKDGSFSHRFN